uniref:Uncharacterized protein n=1 Tax=Acrobeloides nanus TaxID=290746 RepID=A0A914DBJ7_9BILA
MDQSFFSTLSTEDERGEEEIELDETTDPQTQNTIKKTPFLSTDDMTKSFYSYTSRTSDDAPILKELNILDLYPPKKPKRFVVEKIESKKQEEGSREPKSQLVQRISNKLKAGFDSIKDTVTPVLQKAPTITVTEPEFEYKVGYTKQRNDQPKDAEPD